MKDAMLTELYRRVFLEQRKAELPADGEGADRMRQVAIAKNELLSELIDIRTEQIKGTV